MVTKFYGYYVKILKCFLYFRMNVPKFRIIIQESVTNFINRLSDVGMEQQDYKYIDQVLKGDHRAYAYLVDKYKYMVYTIAVKMVENEAEAEDIAQEVFIKAYRQLYRFERRSKFSTWLYTIAVSYTHLLLAGSEDHCQLEAAGDVAEQDDAGEQRQAATASDRQRHAGADARLVLVAPVGDEQERRHAGKFPENQQQEQVFGKHDAEHRGHEEQQDRIEAPETIAGRQIVEGVENDQQADAENQQAEEQPETVEAQAQIESIARQPGQPRDFAMTGEGGRGQRQQQRQASGCLLYTS